MIKQIFTIYDSKSGVWSQPFYTVRTDSAIRDFGYAASQGDNEIGRYPGDFALYLCGTFDDEACVFETQQPSFVISALETLARE